MLKSQYRKWLGSEKLNNESVTEEKAVLKVVELFSSLSDRTIQYAWRLSGIQKFKGLESEKPLDLDDEQMLDDVNERLEELELFENEF